MKLALDWDDTITAYRQGFQVLCKNITEVYVITLNNELTVEMVEDVLKRRISGVCIYPSELALVRDTSAWKADVCEKLGVDLIFDDDPEVICECKNRGINAILVGG